MNPTIAKPAPFIPPPKSLREHADRLTARRALLRLTDARPNEVITCADVCARIGHEVSRSTVCQAAASLGRDLPIEGVPGAGGGYVKLQPMPTLGAERCANCTSLTIIRSCPRSRRDHVGLNCRCWGYKAVQP